MTTTQMISLLQGLPEMEMKFLAVGAIPAGSEVNIAAQIDVANKNFTRSLGENGPTDTITEEDVILLKQG